MFTGIIEAVGFLQGVEERTGDVRFMINHAGLDLADGMLGESISVNGVCLTVVELGSDTFAADVSLETLQRSTLGTLKPGMPLNLERALTPDTRLGGHLVSGHVDGVGTIVGCHDEGRSVRFLVKVPVQLMRYIAEKGSICLDGISLTVNAIDGDCFDINIVPHTLEKTTLGTAVTGQKVNLEVDIIARYLERLMLGEPHSPGSGAITNEFLARFGYIKD